MRKILIALLMLVIVVAGITTASADTAAEECEDYTDCTGDYAFKIDTNEIVAGATTYYDNNNISVTVAADQKSFDFVSENPICAVIVKGGSTGDDAGREVYYAGEGYVASNGLSGVGLESPFNDGGQQAAISHIVFCGDYKDGGGGGSGGEDPVPEFPTLALPIAAIIGLAFLFQRRKE